jgi:hypothetical protein
MMMADVLIVEKTNFKAKEARAITATTDVRDGWRTMDDKLSFIRER